jgi:hypothetical protein
VTLSDDHAAAAADPQDTGGRWTVGRVIGVVVGSILGLVGLGLLAGGVVLTWAALTDRDDDGFVHTDTERFSSGGFAITSDDIDLGSDTEAGDWGLDVGDLVRVRVRATTADPAAPVFVGIARTNDVDAYLAGVPHDVVRDVDWDPFRLDYRAVPGAAEPAAPTEQTIWVASTTGTARQEIVWEPENGSWTVILMNADAARGVAADVEIGVEIRHIWVIVASLLGGGVLLLAGGVALIIAMSRAATRPSVPPPGAPPAEVEGLPTAPEPGVAVLLPLASATVEDPVVVTGRLDEPLSRWLWLVKWLLAIPHLVVLAVLWVVALLLTLIAGVAILFTGRYPQGILGFTSGVLRWTWRVVYYATGVLGTDRYPPFTLGPVPDYPATLDVAPPPPLSRGLVLVKWWLLAIPHYAVIATIGTGWWWGLLRIDRWSFSERSAWAGGLLGILVVIAGVRLLFTGRYPREMFDLIMGLNRWIFRVAGYALLMTDRYPPFRLDQGGAPTRSTRAETTADLTAP